MRYPIETAASLRALRGARALRARRPAILAMSRQLVGGAVTLAASLLYRRNAGRSIAPVLDVPRSPAILEPIIGTRGEPDGVLTPIREIDRGNALYIACDLRLAGVTRDVRVDVVWLFQPAAPSAPLRVLDRSWDWVSSDQHLRSCVAQLVDPSTGCNALGTYECLWSVSRGGVSARLRIRP